MLERRLTYVLFATTAGFTARCLDVEAEGHGRTEEAAIQDLCQLLAGRFENPEDITRLEPRAYRMGELILTP